MNDYSNAKTYGFFSTPESRPIIKQLRDANAEYIEFPAANIVSPDNSETRKLNTKLIETTDWLIFFEPAAVNFFLGKLKEIEFDLYNLDKLRICVLGEITADALRFEQIHTDIILESINQSAVEMIGNFLGKIELFKNQQIIILRDYSIELILEDEIIEKNRQTQIIKICKSSIDDKKNLLKNKLLLTNGAVDQLIITSTDDLITIRHYFDNNAISEIRDLELVCKDENIIRFINSNGFECQKLEIKKRA